MSSTSPTGLLWIAPIRALLSVFWWTCSCISLSLAETQRWDCGVASSLGQCCQADVRRVVPPSPQQQAAAPPSPATSGLFFILQLLVGVSWVAPYLGLGTLVKPRPQAVGWGWAHMRPFVRNPWSEGLDDQLIPMESRTWGVWTAQHVLTSPPGAAGAHSPVRATACSLMVRTWALLLISCVTLMWFLTCQASVSSSVRWA